MLTRARFLPVEGKEEHTKVEVLDQVDGAIVALGPRVFGDLVLLTGGRAGSGDDGTRDLPVVTPVKGGRMSGFASVVSAAVHLGVNATSLTSSPCWPRGTLADR